MNFSSKERTEKYILSLKEKMPGRWKKVGFALLPNALIFSEGVGRGELLVFWILTMHLFKGKKYAFPSVREIEKEGRLSRHTVISAIRKLEEMGYLITEKKRGKRTKYYLRIKVS